MTWKAFCGKLKSGKDKPINHTLRGRDTYTDTGTIILSFSVTSASVLCMRVSSLLPLLQLTIMTGMVPTIMMVRYRGGVFGVYAVLAVIAGCLVAVTGPNIKSILM